MALGNDPLPPFPAVGSVCAMLASLVECRRVQVELMGHTSAWCRQVAPSPQAALDLSDLVFQIGESQRSDPF